MVTNGVSVARVLDVVPGVEPQNQIKDHNKEASVSIALSWLTEEQKEKVTKLGSKFVNYAPHFTGPSTPVDSAKAVLKVMNEASLEKGSSGALVSKFGNKQWM
ncbi:uncharacterized protein FOBCDRAFT_194043 [Fusarium oxysporum Fo47]|uniref:uncharacterized protein n=1 Tax=Fusarium oxysporum Fo47 TaxID=660027 RepID=UPI0028699117|nr:uncharacterized protein FOBCDRAFT_194043 [Fusarium oxysporum Fo47]WJG34355.1 hypothetical protein FOBCDRAFT_194043 [Fusarium oxysporum Fo47]